MNQKACMIRSATTAGCYLEIFPERLMKTKLSIISVTGGFIKKNDGTM
jgi:hypothetical protein